MFAWLDGKKTYLGVGLLIAGGCIKLWWDEEFGDVLLTAGLILAGVGGTHKYVKSRNK